MGSHTESSLTSLVVWSDESRNLKQLANSKSAFPGLFKIVRGHYRNVGSERGQQRIVAIHSVESSQKILAETLKINGGKASRSDQKFSVPLSYQGWFEVLSEDGKSISTLSSVKDIARALPHYCLVREDFKAPISDSGVDDKITVDKTRTVKAGEKLALKNDILASVKTAKGPVNKRYLRCHDEQGKNVFLSFEEDISLSPIAGQNNISGVHSVRGLLDRFRLPVTVRLAHGNVSGKLDKNWSSVFRLISTYTEEVAYVLPTKKDSTMLIIPTREALQFASAKNIGKVKDTAEFQLHMDKCGNFLKAYQNCIQPLSTLPDPEDIEQKKRTVRSKVAPKIGSDGDEIDEEEEELLFEEIEEIYRYVRDGGDPPAPKTRPSKSESKTDAEVENAEPTSNYAYINDLKNASPPAAVPTAAENNVKRSKLDELSEDYIDEPLYADISKIQERKRQRESEAKFPDPITNSEDLIGVSQQSIKPTTVEKVTSSAEDRVKTLANGLVAPVAEVAPLPVAAIAAAALSSDDKRTENIPNSPVQILRNKKLPPPTPQRASQVIPLLSGAANGTLLPSDDKPKANNFISNIAENKLLANSNAEKPDENFRVAKLTSLFKRDIPDKVEEKFPVESNGLASAANEARNSMFNNNVAKSVTKPENQQKFALEPPKVISNGLNAIAKDKEADNRNSAKIPIIAAISRDFQVNKPVDLKKDLGFSEPIKPVVAQPVRSANNLVKSEVTKPAVSIENKVKEVRKDVSDNVSKDFTRVGNKIENVRKEVASKSFESVGNDKTRLASSRMENISNDIANKVIPVSPQPPVAPLLNNLPNTKQNIQRKIIEPTVNSNPVQEIKKEVTSHANRVSNIPNVPLERPNSVAPVANIHKELSKQDIPQLSNNIKAPEIGAHGVTSPRMSGVNIPAVPVTNVPAVKNEIGHLNQDLSLPIVPQVGLLSYATPVIVDRPASTQPVALSYASPVVVDKSSPSLRVGNDLAQPAQSITVVEPQSHQYRPSKEIIPTTVTIGDGVADTGHLPVGWREEESRSYQPPARAGDGVGSTAVNISNGVAAPIERNVLQLSSSNSFNHIESSIVHTSGFDKILQEEELNRRNTLHMDNHTLGKSYQTANTNNRNPSVNGSQGSSSGSFTGVTVYPERTVLSVSNPNNIGHKPPGYATIKSSGNISNGGFSGSSTMRKLSSNTSDPNNGVSITTVHMTTVKTSDQGYRVQESRSSMNQQGPVSGHTVLKISQQPASSGSSSRSGTTYAVNVATLHRVR